MPYYQAKKGAKLVHILALSTCYLGPLLFILSGLVIHPVFVPSSSIHNITQNE